LFLPVGEDEALMPALLTLSDVMGTGHHAAVVAKVSRGKKVAVIGDGAVGCAASSLQNASARNRSSSSAAIPTALLWRKPSADRCGERGEARKQPSACER